MDPSAGKTLAPRATRKRPLTVTGLPGPDVEGRALVVGDDLLLVQAIGLALGAGGIRNRCVHTPEEALRSIAEDAPNLILLDGGLREAAAVCCRIKEDPSSHHIPVLVVSGSTDPDDEIRAFEAGADGYFDRDVRPSVLVARARAAVRTCAFNEQLRGRRHAMRSELELVQRWSRYVVHDLQSPLSAALLNLAFTRQQTAGAGRAVHDTINDIEQSLRQLQRIIGDLLDFDRLASGLLAVNVTVADVGLLAREVAGEAETMARSLGCAVQVTGWAHASCDIALIRRVLWNLVANGLKFGAGRGPVTITLEQLGPGQGCRVAVTDHGEGVPAATRERLFTLYGRDEGNQRPGHGIGLAFCRLVVEAHHGRIWLEDPPGGGATFVFSLPDR